MIFFSHLVIEDKNFKRLDNLKKIGYKVKFEKNLPIDKKKLEILFSKPKNVDLIYLVHEKFIDIELINHNKNSFSNENVFFLGINNKAYLKDFFYSKIFSKSGDIIISTNDVDQLSNFYTEHFNLKKISIQKNENSFLKKKLDCKKISKLKFVNKFINIKNPSIFLCESRKKINKNKKYLNKLGLSCISFLDIYDSVKQKIKNNKTRKIGPIKLPIESSSINKYYFFRDIDDNIIEIVN